MKKVLMYGFGWGNNIEPWLDYFQMTHKQHKLSFFCNNFQFDKDKYPDIEIVELNTVNPILAGIRKKVSGREFDLVYIQGLYDYPVIFFLLLFTKARIKAINIWNNTNFKKGTLKNKKIWQIPFYRIIFRLADKIIFTWYGTFKDFSETFHFSRDKLLIKPWGVRERILNEKLQITNNFTKTFLSGLSQNDIFLFWPESISPDEHIDKFLNALVGLPETLSVKVLIFSGHQKEENYYYRHLLKIIRNHNLSFVEIKIGLYLPYTDIMALWERADLTLKLSSKDQLSNGIIEAMYFRTPIILNDWYPYRKLQEKGFQVELTPLTVKNIREHIETMLVNIQSNRFFYHDSGKHNREIVKKYFNFDKNIMELITNLENLKK